MHQNLGIIFWQFNYSKNSFIVLIPDFIFYGKIAVARHGQVVGLHAEVDIAVTFAEDVLVFFDNF